MFIVRPFRNCRRAGYRSPRTRDTSDAAEARDREKRMITTIVAHAHTRARAHGVCDFPLNEQTYVADKRDARHRSRSLFSSRACAPEGE